MGTLILCAFYSFRSKKTTEMAFDQDLTCLIFPFRWACFPIKIGRNAQWVQLFSMDFDDFLKIYLIFGGKSIPQWEHHIPSIKGCDAIRPALNCFISMIISVDTLCGFAPLITFLTSDLEHSPIYDFGPIDDFLHYSK